MKNKKIENLLQSYSDELFGYNDLFGKFKNLFDTSKLPKIILLTGNKGIGKFTFAFHLINYIFSKKTSIFDRVNIWRTTIPQWFQAACHPVSPNSLIYSHLYFY